MAGKIAAPECPHRPHDLLWVADAPALSAVDGWPAWASPTWLAVAPVVVRRAPMRPDGRIPVGVRGALRSERCAAHVVASQVVRAVRPEEIARRAAMHLDLGTSPLLCLRTLARLAPALDGLALAWGVTGSVGFTLASGFDVLREQSDLDLLVRVTGRDDMPALRTLAGLARAAAGRVDVQVETARGGFALDEWLRTGGPVLLKTAGGPMLCADPWDPPA